MTALALAIIPGLILLAAATFLIFWTLEYFESDVIRTSALIIYCFCFLTIVVTIAIDVIKYSF